MKTKATKSNITLLVIMAISLLAIGAVIVMGTANATAITAYAMESEDELARLANEEESEVFQDVRMLDGGVRSGHEIVIRPSYPITKFTSINYIPNANYFLLNPKHFPNDGINNLNSWGVCTTDALQMLMGYHNYYSDRRIIPTIGNGRTFLNADYGNLNGHRRFREPHNLVGDAPRLAREMVFSMNYTI